MCIKKKRSKYEWESVYRLRGIRAYLQLSISNSSPNVNYEILLSL